MTTEKKYPVKECDYCDHVGMAYTTMTGETICKSCLSDLPTDAAECRKLIVEQRKRITELEKEVERLNAHSLIFDAASALSDDLKKKLEAAGRERDEFGNAFLQLKDELYSCAQCGNGIECKDFDIFNGGIVDDLLNKFAIEQKASEFESTHIPRHAKAGCIGEFKFTIEDGVCCPQCWEQQDDDCDLCGGKSNESGYSDLKVTVPWDLCKSIWLAMNKIKAEELRQQLNGDSLG